MTIGEKIQFYRKRSGLSQEELGNKLLISRQTVSLWEMDKTVPTVDNLIRLKEIFDVSIDELLNSEEISQETKSEAPKESYSFSFDKKEAKSAVSPAIKRGFYIPMPFMIFGALHSLITFVAGEGSSDVAIYLLISLLVYPTMFIASLIVSQRVIKNLANNMSTKEYHYTLFDKAMNVDIYRNDTLVRTYFIDYGAIENVKASNNFISFYFDSQRFVIKRNILIKNSIIETFIDTKPRKSSKLKKSPVLSILSLVLFIASFASIVIALILVAVLSQINHATFSNMWVFYPVAIIPIFSFIFGIVMLASGHKGIKNIIAGAIMTFFLCIYGMFGFLFPETDNDTYYLKAQELTGVELPEYSRVVYTVLTEETHVYLGKNVADTFEEGLENDTRWLKGVPTSMQGLLPPNHAISAGTTYDYCIFYNINDGTSNTLPSKDGTQNFISILYDSDNDRFLIIEYEIEYTK